MQCDLEGRVPWGDIAVLAANIGNAGFPGLELDRLTSLD